MKKYVLVLTSTDSVEEARKIAEGLVGDRLAASAKVAGPLTGTYWWEGEVVSAQEWQCWAKTRMDRYKQVEEAIHRLHSYEVPEILAIPIHAGSSRYLAWLDRALASES